MDWIWLDWTGLDWMALDASFSSHCRRTVPNERASTYRSHRVGRRDLEHLRNVANCLGSGRAGPHALVPSGYERWARHPSTLRSSSTRWAMVPAVRSQTMVHVKRSCVQSLRQEEQQACHSISLSLSLSLSLPLFRKFWGSVGVLPPRPGPKMQL